MGVSEMTLATEQLVTADKGQDSVEMLRRILSKEQHREITYSEASEVGESLIKFYEILAGAVD